MKIREITNLLKMAFGIYVSLVICILTQIAKPQNTVKLIKGSGETQLSEMNERLQRLEKTMNTIVSDSQQEMQGLRNTLNKVERKIIELNSALNNAKNQIKELKYALKGRNELLYTVHYTKKNWTDADLSCKAGGGHLVSIETMEEYNHVVELSQKQRCYHPSDDSGFWTSATNVGVNNWVWE